MRPKKAKAVLRHCQASAWLTESEYAQLAIIAEEAGASISSFCRNMLVSVIEENKKRKQVA